MTRRRRRASVASPAAAAAAGPPAGSSMRVVHDEPGWRLTLTAPEAEPPVAQLGCFGVVLLVAFGFSGVQLLPLLWAAWAGQPGTATGAWLTAGMSGAFLAAVFVVGARRIVRGTLALRVLDVDRGPATLSFAERAAYGRYAREASFALGDLEEAVVALESGAHKGAAVPTRVRLTLRARPPGARPGTREGLVEQRLAFAVEGLDRPEEVADFALRLGAAAGFGAYRVVRHDARDTEVLLGFGYAAGFEPLRAPEVRADYARDKVAAPARQAVAEERVPPFEPAAFAGRPPLREWVPGRRVLFHKRWSWLGTLAALPFLLLPLGPLALALGVGEVVGSRLMGAAVLFVLTLPLAGLAAAGAWLALPRAVELDWERGRLLLRRAWGARAIAFSAIEALELRGERRRHKPKNGAAYFTYHCQLAAWHRNDTGGSDRCELVQTDEYREDPATPWRAALPLVTELAQALGVKRRVIDFDA